MLHQYARYGACRYRRNKIGGREVMTGTIPVGTIIYIQNGIRALHPGLTSEAECRDPWIVDAWRGDYGNRHLAVVRSLRTGEKRSVADWILLRCVDCFCDFQKPPRTPKRMRPAKAKQKTLGVLLSEWVQSHTNKETCQ